MTTLSTGARCRGSLGAAVLMNSVIQGSSLPVALVPGKCFPKCMGCLAACGLREEVSKTGTDWVGTVLGSPSGEQVRAGAGVGRRGQVRVRAGAGVGAGRCRCGQVRADAGRVGSSRCSQALEEPLPWVLGCVCRNPHFGGVPAAGPAQLPAAAACVWHVVLNLSFRSLLESIVPQHTPGTHSPGKTD